MALNFIIFYFLITRQNYIHIRSAIKLRNLSHSKIFYNLMIDKWGSCSLIPVECGVITKMPFKDN